MSEENFYEEIDSLPIATSGQVKFNTAILTYPSDFDQQISVGIITEYLSEKFDGVKCKIVIAREDADEMIQRNHFHCYLDFKKQVSISPNKYFDIPLQHPVVVFIKADNTRIYKDKNELESELGWDNPNEMAELLSSYIRDKGYQEWKLLTVAHPNLQVKKRYGSKYQMLRYVVKQGLVARSNFEINQELLYLEDNEKQLKEKFDTAIHEKKVSTNDDVQIVDELIDLCKSYIDKTKRQLKRKTITKKEFDDFSLWLKEAIIKGEKTKDEIYREMLADNNLWKIYLKNVLGIDRVIDRMVKARIVKPKANYKEHNKYYLPRKLYNYVKSLDDWIRRWNEGDTMEARPKGLVVISPSRYGKTDLFISLGSFSYIANIWSLDQWDNKAAFTIFDDMDPGNDGRGLNFTWFKGFFGAQKALNVTDKYRPKRTIVNGKPLVWLSNYELEDVFKNPADIEYIYLNCEVIHLNQPLWHEGQEWIEGHCDYIEFDTRTTWWYQNKVKNGESENENEDTKEDNETTCAEKNEDDESESDDEIEPLNLRKKRLGSISEESKMKFENEKGRLIKKSRTENKSDPVTDQ